MTRRSAYTLLEVLLVLVLLGVLAALAVPALDTMYSDVRARAAADTVRAAWSEAHSRAVNESRPYRFSLVLDQGNFRVAPDSPEYWGGGEAPAATESANAPLVLDEALPNGVRFRAVETLMQDLPSDGDSSQPAGTVDPNSWSGTIIFLPDGTVRTEQENLEVGIRTPAAAPLVVRMRTLTGVITIRPYRQEGGRQ
jgi:prepilin-type N-terminal cleavage/methylation domain-containing protein